MKVSFDTNEDSVEELLKIMDLIGKAVESKQGSVVTQNQPPESQTYDLFAPVSEPEPHSTVDPTPAAQPEKPAPAGIFNLFNDDPKPVQTNTVAPEHQTEKNPFEREGVAEAHHQEPPQLNEENFNVGHYDEEKKDDSKLEAYF